MKDKIINNPELLDEYEILNIKYNKDGSLKPFYVLSSERNIKEMQSKSDENELDFKFNQGTISKEEYEKEKEELNLKLKIQNEVYDDLIFDMINSKELEEVKEEVKNANLNEIDLKRLSSSLESIAIKKITDFKTNNDEFKNKDLEEWNYSYNKIAKNYEKVREVERFILDLIK